MSNGEGNPEMTNEQYAEDLKVMIQADAGHLATALANGDRVHAHTFVDAIINNCRELEDLGVDGATAAKALEITRGE